MAYSLLARRTLARLAAGAGLAAAPTVTWQEPQLLEYSRPGWEYHAKGIWLRPPGALQPCLTAIGSPNYGHRSVLRDLEAQLLLLSRCPTLQQVPPSAAPVDSLSLEAEACLMLLGCVYGVLRCLPAEVLGWGCRHGAMSWGP